LLFSSALTRSGEKCSCSGVTKVYAVPSLPANSDASKTRAGHSLEAVGGECLLCRCGPRGARSLRSGSDSRS
jgi:hypothetical protein